MKSNQTYMRIISILAVVCLSLVSQKSNAQAPWYEKHCLEKMQYGGAYAYRKCMREHRGKEASKLKKKACFGNQCLYKLHYHSRKDKGGGWYSYTYKGSGYTLNTDDTSIPISNDGEHGASLIDPLGRTTIVRMCGGSACGGHYYYGSGPLRGADLREIAQGQNYKSWYWVLKLPK